MLTSVQPFAQFTSHIEGIYIALFCCGILMWATLLHCWATLPRHQVFSTEQQSRLRLAQVCITAAPLLGLLGTVSGIILTFSSLQHVSIAEYEMMAIGIRRALVSTKIGLILGVPGFIVLNFIKDQTHNRGEHECS